MAIQYGYLVPREGSPNPYLLDQPTKEQLDWYVYPIDPIVDARVKRLLVKI